jgi:hypothetical protein
MEQPEATIVNIFKAARNYGCKVTRLEPQGTCVWVWCESGGTPFNFYETVGASDATDIALTMGEMYNRAKGVIRAGVKL